MARPRAVARPMPEEVPVTTTWERAHALMVPPGRSSACSSSCAVAGAATLGIHALAAITPRGHRRVEDRGGLPRRPGRKEPWEGERLERSVARRTWEPPSVLEQAADGLAVVDAADRLGEHGGGRDDPDLAREGHGLGLDGVGGDQPADRAGVQPLHRPLGEDAVADGGHDRAGALADQLLG